MHSATRREQEVERTRQTILDAAREAFVTSGYEQTSVREVARRAGLSHGTIYLHFRDKDDLLYQVSEAEFGRLLGRLRSLPRSQDPIQRLSDALYEVGRYGMEFPHQYQLMMGHRPSTFSTTSAPRFGPMAEQMSSFMADLVHEAQKRSFVLASGGPLDELSLIAGVHGVVTMFDLKLIDREMAEETIRHTISLMLIALTGASCPVRPDAAT
ncbi:MAG TPA: TetR/AcrR family transcriptional regulator [Thermomicrobiales bacterium]|nr:TetR/AcrR family transcriptional regulator [Thermomicrobiales bacterium]